jgi:hypothetical protein
MIPRAILLPWPHAAVSWEGEVLHRIPVVAISIAVIALTVVPQVCLHAATPGGSSGSNGRVHGVVRDAVGVAVADASVLAVGTKVIAARTDTRGRFQMSVPPGDYILRATRPGYISTYRESVRVLSSSALERTITLFRQADAAAAAVPDDHSHSELAWRLRHLPRSVLRDGTATATGPDRSLFGRAVDSSVRLASRIAETDFSGQVNFVTTATASLAAASFNTFPRSVAYVVLGAPVGSGDWRVRGAVASGTRSAWNVLGEYEARRTETHALRFGVSYSAHGPKAGSPGQWSRPVLEARSVAGMFLEDRWRLLPDLDVDVAARADRYDFLSTPQLLSASGGVRARVLPSTVVSVRLARSMIAPGAEEFLPPSAEGPWLPPERTFATLVSRDRMQPEEVRHAEFGFRQEFGTGHRARAIQARVFAQQTSDQIVTLFGVGGQSSRGHYHVARAGAVNLSGWAVGVSGTLLRSLSGQIEYARLTADWHSMGRTRGLRRIAPSAVRDASEAIDDITASLEARFNQARTRLSVVYRSSTAFSGDDGDESPSSGGRFDLQFHQALPYRPFATSRLELLFAVRTLFRDPRDGSSAYDELLTVAPPLRLLGGIQVRF